MTRPATVLDATLHDGRVARGQPVRVQLSGGVLTATDGERHWRWPAHAVVWPERTRHGRRMAQLPGGGLLGFDDAAAFDAWRQACGARESWVVRAQQDWGAVLAALLLCLVLVGATWRWGIPGVSALVLTAIPPSVERSIGETSLASLRRQTLRSSRTPPARQQQLQAEFEAALARAYPPAERPEWTLHFADAGRDLGPNAFALPGGHIVVTDALVELLDGRDDALLGVLGHEYGHVQARHGLRGLVQATLVGVLVGAVVGDFSSVLAGAPALLAQQSYSRDFERDADAAAVRVLRAAGRSPLAMTVLFERLQTWRDQQRAEGDDDGAALPDWLGIALASHPADEERIRAFREAAAH